MNRLLGAIRREGITVVPLSIYFNDRGRAKVELGLARGKRKADKRQAERQRDWQRSRARILDGVSGRAAFIRSTHSAGGATGTRSGSGKYR